MSRDLPGLHLWSPDDAEPEDHDLDCPEHPTGEDPDRETENS